MTRHTITIDGERYTFEWHPVAGTEAGTLVAPGILPSRISSLRNARAVLRSVYAKEASQ